MSDTEKSITATKTDAEQNPVVEALQKAAEGLLFLSETDAPLTPFFWPDDSATAPLTEARLRELAEVSGEVPVKSSSLTAFFRPAVKEEEWHNDEEKAEVARFKDLVDTLQSTLKKPTVWRVGETKITAYVVGAVDGGWAGVQTQVVET